METVTTTEIMVVAMETAMRMEMGVEMAEMLMAMRMVVTIVMALLEVMAQKVNPYLNLFNLTQVAVTVVDLKLSRQVASALAQSSLRTPSSSSKVNYTSSWRCTRQI